MSEKDKEGANGVDVSSDAEVGSNPTASTKTYTPAELEELGITHTYPYTVKEFLERRRQADIKIGCIKQSLGE
tara:strand:+ start:274 stop:492 length:219 start_codon:yes stop_codon:yes gene_type:complete